MLSFRDISIAFDGTTLLAGFDLEVGRGEKVVLWGPSGVGKSSLMSLVPGFHTPAAGIVSVDGEPVTPETIDAIRRKIAWVPQEASLPVEFVRQLVDIPFGFRVNRHLCPERNILIDTFAKLGLGKGIYEKRLNEISAGEKQRVMIAIAALLQKPLLLLDEPTSALDPAATALLSAFLHSLHGTTMLAISHDNRFIETFERQIQIG